MSYKKFDDANPKVDQSARSVFDAFWRDPFRRAIEGISNRVLGGTSGTGWFPNVTAGVADGGTGGIKTATAVTVVINGKAYVVAPGDNLKMPTTQIGTNCVAYYLISTQGTSGTITGPGNIILKSDYATPALAAAACKLPDLPAGHCVLGKALFHAPAAGTNLNPADFGKFGTAGTATYTDLICMPIDE